MGKPGEGGLPERATVLGDGVAGACERGDGRGCGRGWDSWEGMDGGGGRRGRRRRGGWRTRRRTLRFGTPRVFSSLPSARCARPATAPGPTSVQPVSNHGPTPARPSAFSFSLSAQSHRHENRSAREGASFPILCPLRTHSSRPSSPSSLWFRLTPASREFPEASRRHLLQCLAQCATLVDWSVLDLALRHCSKAWISEISRHTSP